MFYVDTGDGGGFEPKGSVVKKTLFYNKLLWCLAVFY
jgi:hypothetical protein